MPLNKRTITLSLVLLIVSILLIVIIDAPCSNCIEFVSSGENRKIERKQIDIYLLHKSDFDIKEIETKFEIINLFFDTLKIGYSLNVKANNSTKAFDGPYTEVLKRFEKQDLLTFEDNFLVLVDSSRITSGTNVIAQYYDADVNIDRNGTNRQADVKLIRGGVSLIEDPLLFIHEFLHSSYGGHMNFTSDSAQKENIMNIMSGCNTFSNFSISVNQVLKAHSIKEELLVDSILVPIRPRWAVFNNSICLNDLNDLLEGTDSISLCICDELTEDIIIDTLHYTNVSRHNPYHKNRELLDVDPYYKTDTTELEKVFQNEYSYLGSKGVELISEDEYIRIKFETVRKIRRINILYYLYKLTTSFDATPISNIESLMNQDSLSVMLNFILKNKLLKPNQEVIVNNGNVESEVEKKYDYSGKVVDLVTGLPITGANILRYKEKTSIKGTFSILDSPRIMSLTVSAKNYFDRSFEPIAGDNGIIALEKTFYTKEDQVDRPILEIFKKKWLFSKKKWHKTSLDEGLKNHWQKCIEELVKVNPKLEEGIISISLIINEKGKVEIDFIPTILIGKERALLLDYIERLNHDPYRWNPAVIGDEKIKFMLVYSFNYNLDD